MSEIGGDGLFPDPREERGDQSAAEMRKLGDQRAPAQPTDGQAPDARYAAQQAILYEQSGGRLGEQADVADVADETVQPVQRADAHAQAEAIRSSVFGFSAAKKSDAELRAEASKQVRDVRDRRASGGL